MRLRFFLSFWVIFFSLNSFADRPGNPGIDITDQYQDKYDYFQNNQLSIEDIEHLREYKILLVPGFFSNLLRHLAYIANVVVDLQGYFDDQEKFFKEIDVEVELVPVESEAGLEPNAVVIRRSILNTNKSVILFGHSKGGMDILEMLLKWESEGIQDRVKAMISVQTPFYGTQIADDFYNNGVLRIISDIIVRIQGGGIESLRSLTTFERELYHNGDQERGIEGRVEEISRLVKKIPVINFGSWIESGIPTILAIPQHRMLSMDLKNDGFLPLYSTSLKGAMFIKVKNIDHASTIMTNPLLPYDRYAFMSALMKIVLEQIRKKQYYH